MNRTHGVSVIVPVYNAQDTVAECIESLLGLDYPPGLYEIICVDNGSTDRSRQTLERYGTRIVLHDEPRRGPSAARNCGLRIAKHDVVAFTDADCTVDPAWLRHLVHHVNDPPVGVVGGRIRARRPCNRIEAFGERIHDHERAIRHVIPPYAITMNWCSRRAVLGEVGGFNERLKRGEDVDLSYRLSAAGYELRYESRANVYHRNERSILGLFYEGYRHGFHSEAILTLHRRFLNASGKRIKPIRGRIAFLRGLLLSARAAPGQQKLWEFLFNSGKLLGQVHGRVRETARNLLHPHDNPTVGKSKFPPRDE